MYETLEETDFDYIVLGTGLIESILAGALARVGKKVLHLDSHQNYGGNWNVFGFKELAQWSIDRNKVEQEHLIEGNLSVDYERNYARNFRNVDFKLYSKDSEEDETTEPTPTNTDQKLFDAFFEDASTGKSTYAEKKLLTDLLKASRSYNLDSTPKLLGSRDGLVETLIRSGVGQYLEFKGVDDIYVFDKSAEELEKVPSSKEDIFTNKSVTLIEKRKLMKFLTFAMEFDEKDTVFEGTESMSYMEFLKNKFKITGKLLHAMVYAIALVDDKASIKTGLEKTHKFVKAMGRFGKGAYICPLYGSGGEIAQAFCRVCAVHGGVYILNQPLDRFVVNNDTNECTGIITKDGQEFKCSRLIAGIDYLNTSWLPEEQIGTWISRAIIVTDAPLASGTEYELGEGLNYSVIPPEDETGNADRPIYGIHQNQESMACPKGQYVTYLWTSSKAPNALEKAKDLLLQKKIEDETTVKRAECIFTVFFENRVRSSENLKDDWKLPKNVIPCSDPDTSLDFESAYNEAVKSFYYFEPAETEFMPAAESDPNEN